MSGLTDELVGRALGPRRRRDPRGRPRAGARRPVRRAAARSGPTPRSSAADPGPLRIGLVDRARWPSIEVEPDVRRSGAATRRELLEALGHAVDGVPTLADAARPRRSTSSSTFLTRWAAGQAATPATSSARSLGRELDRGRRRAADLGAGRGWAASAARGRVPARRRRSTSSSRRMIAGWFDGGLRPAADADASASRRRRSGTFDDSGPDPMAAFDARRSSRRPSPRIFNATGQPAISLPLHWTEDGLPIGIQLVAAARRARTC